MLCQNVEAFIKDSNICLTSKADWHKFYKNSQFLLVPINK